VNRLELKQWRRARYLSQPGLAELLGVSKNTVFRWESGENDVPPFLHYALDRLDQIFVFGPDGAEPIAPPVIDAGRARYRKLEREKVS
jgi:transcriptional regulator with XRE-family HTH domain